MVWKVSKEKLRYEIPDKKWYLDRYYKDSNTGFSKQVSFQVNQKGEMWVDKILLHDKNGRFRKKVLPTNNQKIPFSYESFGQRRINPKRKVSDFL